MTVETPRTARYAKLWKDFREIQSPEADGPVFASLDGGMATDRLIDKLGRR